MMKFENLLFAYAKIKASLEDLSLGFLTRSDTNQAVQP